MIYKVVISAILLVIFCPRIPLAINYGKLDIGVNLRLRYEYLNNYSLKAYGANNTDDMLLERVILNAQYKASFNIKLFLELYDAHFWLNDFTADDFSPNCSYQNPFDLKQLFIEMNPIPQTPVGLKIGRQQILYGDIRIWGPGDWSNSGKYTWDAVKIFFNSNALQFDFFYGQRVIANPNEFDIQHYNFHATGIYSTIKNIPFILDLFYVGKYDLHDSTKGELGYGKLVLNTAGSHLKGKANKFTYEATLAYQSGKLGKDNSSAYATNIFLGYIFNSPLQPKLLLGHTFASGDKNPNDGKHQTFDGVFGAAAKYYGRMNLFFWMNIHDFQADFKIKSFKKINTTLSYHYFCLAQAKDSWYKTSGKPYQNRKDITGKSGVDLGHEIDFLIKTNINKSLELLGGYSHLFAGHFIRNTGAGVNADWAFTQMTWSF